MTETPITITAGPCPATPDQSAFEAVIDGLRVELLYADLRLKTALQCTDQARAALRLAHVRAQEFADEQAANEPDPTAPMDHAPLLRACRRPAVMCLGLR